MFQIQFVLLFSRQGKVRLTKWYSPYTQKERSKVMSIISSLRDCCVVDHQLLDMYFFLNATLSMSFWTLQCLFYTIQLYIEQFPIDISLELMCIFLHYQYLFIS
jgi:hypothetical protein